VALGEFDLIRRFFASANLNFARAHVALGQGDDAAILSVPAGYQLVMSIDTLNESVHFPPDADPFLLAQRCLLVNLSDLAAMGAEPLAFTLAISLPRADEHWLQAFSHGLAQARLCLPVPAGRWRHHTWATLHHHSGAWTGACGPGFAAVRGSGR